VRAHAAEVRAAVDDIFARCRLEPRPDAALHPLLARLIAASGALAEDPAATAPLAEIRAVLEHYAALFDEVPA